MALFGYFVLLVQVVDRQEGDDDGSFVSVGLVLRIIAVAGHLAFL